MCMAEREGRKGGSWRRPESVKEWVPTCQKSARTAPLVQQTREKKGTAKKQERSAEMVVPAAVPVVLAVPVAAAVVVGGTRETHTRSSSAETGRSTTGPRREHRKTKNRCGREQRPTNRRQLAGYRHIGAQR